LRAPWWGKLAKFAAMAVGDSIMEDSGTEQPECPGEIQRPTTIMMSYAISLAKVFKRIGPFYSENETLSAIMYKDESFQVAMIEMVQFVSVTTECDASMLLEPAEKMTLKEYDKELDKKRKASVSLENEEQKVALDNDLAKMHLLAGVKLEHEKIWMLLTNFEVPGPSSIILHFK
ncbi:hypothetical protein Tco_0984450, partial [Tanacetum coccineum]